MKKLINLLLVIGAVFVLASCGSNVRKTNDILLPDQIDKSKQIEIKFYHAMGQDKKEIIQEIADRFSADMLEKYGVTVSVKQTSQGDYQTLRKTIASQISSGNQPTIAQTYPDHVSLYLGGEAVRELDSYIESADYGMEGSEADCYGFIDTFWKEGRIYDLDKTLYSIPFNKSTEVLYYNKTIFDKYSWEAPKTWEDVLDICEKWKQTTEYKKQVDDDKKVAGIGIDSEANLFITLTQQWGSEFTKLNSDGTGDFVFNNDKTKQALEWLLGEFNEKNIVSTTYFGTNYCSDAFKAGQCVMTIGSSAGASYNVASDGSFVTGVAPYPQFEGKEESEKQVIQQGTNVSLFKCTDPQEELFGWLFIKYLTNYESALYWSLNTSYFAVRKDVSECEEYKKFMSGVVEDESGQTQTIYDPIKETLKVALAQSSYYYTSPAFPGSAKARDEVELVIQEILYNPKEYSIEKALNQAIDNLLYN